MTGKRHKFKYIKASRTGELYRPATLPNSIFPHSAMVNTTIHTPPIETRHEDSRLWNIIRLPSRSIPPTEVKMDHSGNENWFRRRFQATMQRQVRWTVRGRETEG